MAETLPFRFRPSSERAAIASTRYALVRAAIQHVNRAVGPAPESHPLEHSATSEARNEPLHTISVGNDTLTVVTAQRAVKEALK